MEYSIHRYTENYDITNRSKKMQTQAFLKKLILFIKCLQLCYVKRYLKFFLGEDCLRGVEVRSQAGGPLYLKEVLPMSRLNLGSVFPKIVNINSITCLTMSSLLV